MLSEIYLQALFNQAEDLLEVKTEAAEVNSIPAKSSIVHYRPIKPLPNGATLVQCVETLEVKGVMERKQDDMKVQDDKTKMSEIAFNDKYVKDDDHVIIW